MNPITTTDVDVDMWMNDHELGNLDDCFSAMETFDPDDPYNVQEMEPLPKDPSSLSMSEDRRNSMLLNDMNAEWNNEFQECFEQFHSNYSPVPSPQDRPQETRRSRFNQTAPFGTQSNASPSEDFDRNFRRSLSNLEQSMRRSEQSRKMLGEHRSAISVLYNNITASAGGTNNNTSVRGRSQLLSYMTSLGNNTL